MGKFVIVGGDTGSGKSRSLKNLESKSSFLINVLGKDLPWKSSKQVFNKSNSYITEKYEDIMSLLRKADNNKEIKTFIIDDIGFLMTTELFNRSKETGYTKFTEIGKHMQQLIQAIKYLRDDLVVVAMFHTDFIKSDDINIKLKLKTIGQLLEDKYNPLATTAIALFTYVKLEENTPAKYYFVINKAILDGIEVPAKTPEDMFEETLIENDLSLVINRINEYYN